MSSKFFVIDDGQQGRGFAININDIRVVDVVRDTGYETTETTEQEGRGIFGRTVVIRRDRVVKVPRFTVEIQFRNGVHQFRFNADTHAEAAAFHARLLAALATA